MRAAVADTSPLRYLVLIGAIEILPRLFERVIVPDIVHAERRHAHAPAPVRSWANAPPSWLVIMSAPSVHDSDLQALDAGERAAIALAMTLSPAPILIDDRAGVAAARAKGLDIVGTLGLLERAARRGLIDLRDAVATLQATNFHATLELYERLLARDLVRRGAKP
jgi:predicted nucleic acid-binding protein